MQRATGLEAIAVGGDAAHGMDRHRTADDALVLTPRPVCPGDGQFDLLLERGMRQLGGDAPDRLCRNARNFSCLFRRVLWIEIALDQQAQHRPRHPPVGQRELTGQCRRDVGVQGLRHRLAHLVEAQHLAVGIAGEQPVIGGARRMDGQPRRVGVAHQEIEIDLLRLQQFMDDRENQRAVGARPHAEPFVGDGGIGGLHRIDRNVFGAARLELGETRLDRVAVVILGDAEHHEVARVVPVRLAEFPEAATDGIEARGGHVDRTETAMSGIVGRAELLRPPAGQRLALVASGEEGELARVGFADVAQPFGGQRHRLVPFDLLEIAGAALAHPQQRLGQPRRRVVVHDAGRALAAQHALVHRMGLVALDVANAAILQMHLDAATAGAHVAGGRLDLVRYRWRQILDRSLRFHQPTRPECCGCRRSEEGKARVMGDTNRERSNTGTMRRRLQS